MTGERPLLLKTVSVLIFLPVLLLSGFAEANQTLSHQALLAEIVPAVVQIMRRNGYEMADYRVVGGHTDVLISGPSEKHAFFGYVDKGRLKDGEKVVLSFYEADQLPLAGRVQVIDYLLKLHEENGGSFALSLYMTKAKYKKPQPVMPVAFVEINLNRVSR